MFTRRAFVAVAASSLVPISGTHAQQKKTATQSLRFQASWINDAEFLGYFVALDDEHAYYRRSGLDVKYISGGPHVVPESALLSNQADIALTTPETTANLIMKDKVPFRIIGAQYQKNPIGIVSLAKSGIRSPRDLEGRKLAVPPVNELTVRAMLAINKVDPAKVTIVPYQYDPTPLLQGAVDATTDFVTNVPHTIRRRGEQPHYFLLYDAGFKIFNDTVVVLEETLRTRRREIVAWLRASRAGWVENFRDPAKYPRRYEHLWFKGTGRTIENEIDFNNAQKPLMEHSSGFFSMSGENIRDCIQSLGKVNLRLPPEAFDTSLLDEVRELEKTDFPAK